MTPIARHPIARHPSTPPIAQLRASAAERINYAPIRKPNAVEQHIDGTRTIRIWRYDAYTFRVSIEDDVNGVYGCSEGDTAKEAYQKAEANYRALMRPAPRFNLLDREDDPAYGVDASDAGDTAIRPGSTVRVLASPATCPLFVKVLRVFSDDTLRVCFKDVPAVTMKLRVDEVAMGLCKEAAEVEAAS